MAVTMNPTLVQRIGLSAAAAIALGIIVAVTVYAVTRPSHNDFQTARTDLLKQATSTQADIIPSFNEYLKSFKLAQNETSSIEKAKAAAVKDKQAYDKIESNARQAIKELKESRAANDTATSAAISQYAQASETSINYYTSLLNFYDEFSAIFASEENLCRDVLVGETSSLAERRDKLAQATKDCYPALNRLKESDNVTYVEYAKTIENRVKNLEKYAAAVAKGEADYKKFVDEQKAVQSKAEALSDDTSADEVQKLRDEIKVLSTKIKDSKAAFDAAASSYKSIVEELPSLYGDVYTKAVPKQTDILDSLLDVRKKTLVIVLDDKLLDK